MYLVISTHEGNPPFVTVIDQDEGAVVTDAFYQSCRENLGKYTTGVFLMRVNEAGKTELLRSVYSSEGSYLFDPDGSRDFSMLHDGDSDSEEFRRFVLREDAD